MVGDRSGSRSSGRNASRHLGGDRGSAILRAFGQLCRLAPLCNLLKSPATEEVGDSGDEDADRCRDVSGDISSVLSAACSIEVSFMASTGVTRDRRAERSGSE